MRKLGVFELAGMLWAVAGVLFASGPARAGTSFSVDDASPSISAPLTPDDVLLTGPTVLTEGNTLGMADDFAGGNYDDLDALSFGDDIVSDSNFFSVDRLSLGANGTGVFSESGAAEAAGDMFLSDGNGSNSLQTDEQLLGLIPGFFGDDLDALELTSAGGNTYFSINELSASNGFGGGGLSNDIFLNDLNDVFATGEIDIGLLLSDDIDALILDDGFNPGVLDPGIDTALFSLDTFSASVLGGGFSAADLLFTDFTGSFVLFMSAADLGLLSTDDVNALTAVPEPSTGLLVLFGLAVAAQVRRCPAPGFRTKAHVSPKAS